MVNSVVGRLRLEHRPNVPNNSRIWIDITVNGVPAQSILWFSGSAEEADSLMAGKAMIDDDCRVVPAPENLDSIDTIGDLIGRLSTCDQNSRCMILDSHNGAGNPRQINFGPVSRVVTDLDSENTADCEGIVGQAVTVIGYGCY